MIYNPYNTTIQNPGVTQPGMVQQASYPMGQQPMVSTSSYPMVTNQVPNTTTYQHVQQSMPMAMAVPPCSHQLCGAQVPLMQPTGQNKVVEKQPYSVQNEIVYVEQKPLKSSTMPDYNLYLTEKEYYCDDEPTYQKTGQTVYPQARADKKGSPLTCQNLPLATAYVRTQTYTRLNNPTETLQQGTAFNELYDVYTPQKVAQPNIFMLKGGCR